LLKVALNTITLTLFEITDNIIINFF
jgi:hypothetical protein